MARAPAEVHLSRFFTSLDEACRWAEETADKLVREGYHVTWLKVHPILLTALRTDGKVYSEELIEVEERRYGGVVEISARRK